MAPTLQSDIRQHPVKKTSKHIQERRRRARINAGYLQLKSIVYPCVKNKTHLSGSKLEKADILEMTLQHVKELQSSLREGRRPAVDQYSAGFAECLGQVSNFLSSCEKVDIETRLSILNHLADHCTSSADRKAPHTSPSRKETSKPRIVTAVQTNNVQVVEYPQQMIRPPSGVIYFVPAAALQSAPGIPSLEAAAVITPVIEAPKPSHQPAVLSVSVPTVGLLPTPPQSPQMTEKIPRTLITSRASDLHQKISTPPINISQIKMVPPPSTSPLWRPF